MGALDLYGADLAWVHDDGFSELAQAAARMALERLQAPGREAGGDAVVGDLGCGGGATMESLADAGATVWGLDASPAMVALARRRCPPAEVLCGSVHDPDIQWPRSDGLLAVGEVLNYDDPGRQGREDPGEAAEGQAGVAADRGHHRLLDRFFHRAHQTLRPGGFLLFDVATTGRATEPTTAERSGQDWRVSATAVEAAGLLVRTIDTWRRRDGALHHGREVHRLHLLDPDRVEDALAAAGFQVDRWGGYDDYPLQPGWDAFLARKP